VLLMNKEPPHVRLLFILPRMDKASAFSLFLALALLAACGGSGSTLSVEQTVQAAVEETVSAGSNPEPTPEPSPTSTSIPVATETPSPTITPSPTVTPPPTPTSIVAPTATILTTPLPNRGKWVVSNEREPLDDSTTATATLRADNGSGIYGDPINLVLRCKSGELDAYVNWESFLGLDDVVVTHRVGSQEAIQSYWGLSTDYQATFYPGTAQHFISQLAVDDSFVAQVTPYAESPITAMFRLSGIELVAQDILAACGKSVSPIISGRYVDPEYGWSVEVPTGTIVNSGTGTTSPRTQITNQLSGIEGTVISRTLFNNADVDETCASEINRLLKSNIRASDERDFRFGDHTGIISYYPYSQVAACVSDGTNIAILLLQGADILEVDGIVKSLRLAS